MTAIRKVGSLLVAVLRRASRRTTAAARSTSRRVTTAARAVPWLDTAGLGLITAAAGTVHTVAGLAAAGLSLLAISWMRDDRSEQ